jgi:hypothetical protein
MECDVCLNSSVQALCTTCEAVKPRLDNFKKQEFDHGYAVDQMRKQYNGVPVTIGLSGGVDSSYIVALAAEANLDIKVIHFDNGWNSGLACNNIANLINKSNLNLNTIVMHWPTFKRIQRAFLFASVPDVELVTDHAIFAVMSRTCLQDKERVFLSGANFTTEHHVSEDHTWHKLDIKNIKAIATHFEDVDFDRYPSVSPWTWIHLRARSSGARIDTPLNEFWYRRDYAVSYLTENCGFSDYKFKHEESTFTKIYQRTILPSKFSYIKVQDHLNCLIRNGELTKAGAKEKLREFTDYSINDDYEFRFFLNKLDLSFRDWERILSDPPKPHSAFKNSHSLISLASYAGKLLGLRGSA